MGSLIEGAAPTIKQALEQFCLFGRQGAEVPSIPPNVSALCRIRYNCAIYRETVQADGFGFIREKIASGIHGLGESEEILAHRSDGR